MAKLERSLGPWMLWGLGVGYVISGMYFGWNLGLEAGGTMGLGIATVFIIILYTTFTFSYTELACAIPKAGGVLDYTSRALGKDLGYVAGLAQVIEFVFAPPAIAAAIGAYFHIFLPEVPVIAISIVAYMVFTALNIYGVKAAALFELAITILAVGELLLFAGITLPHFKMENLSLNAFPNGWKGAWAAIPFAIWFFLALEGVANVAEETQKPQRNILLGFGSALLTLVVLCILTFGSSVGVAGWEAIVYPPGSTTPSDSPLPLALSKITGENQWLYHLLVTIGLLGLVASFHGIILAAGRATFEMGRLGYFIKQMGLVHKRFKTPANALLTNMILGILALITGKTGDIIIMACFGALTLMIFGTLSMLKLRKSAPDMPRPFKTPFYPWFPWIALSFAIIALIAMITIYSVIFLLFAGILAAGYAWYHFFVKHKYHERLIQ
ncbi:MAG: ethanolamine permease [Chitinophagaceae bacterium]|nr:ethanolamine permease [Chitinophagaceae bacterium]